MKKGEGEKRIASQSALLAHPNAMHFGTGLRNKKLKNLTPATFSYVFCPLGVQISLIQRTKKASIKRYLLFGGGEGLSPITATNENEAFPPEIQPIHKIFSYIVFPIKRENLKLFRL